MKTVYTVRKLLVFKTYLGHLDFRNHFKPMKAAIEKSL